MLKEIDPKFNECGRVFSFGDLDIFVTFSLHALSSRVKSRFNDEKANNILKETIKRFLNNQRVFKFALETGEKINFKYKKCNLIFKCEIIPESQKAIKDKAMVTMDIITCFIDE
jgi:hypothetical protein